MIFLGFIAGLILLLAGGGWFAGASTVGAILAIICGLIIFIQFVVFGWILSKV